MRFLYCQILLINSLLIINQGLFAQADTTRKSFTVSGNSRIYSQLATRSGNYQELPQNFIRWELNNTFNFYGIPVISNLFVTSEQSRIRQSITGFRIGIDARSVARNKLYEKFKFLRFFPTLEAGNCRPSYSPLTLNGVNLRGVNIEFNPGVFYSAFATGKLTRAVQNEAPGYQGYDRKLTFARLGVGKSRQSYFAFSFLHAEDDPESLTPTPLVYHTDPDTLVYDAETFIHGRDSGYLYVLPKENYVASAELTLLFFQKKLLVTGEFAGSLATANQNAYGFTFEEIPDEFQEKLFFNASSRVDFAYVIQSKLKLKNTDFSGSIRRIGPGFVSLGTAYLRTDINQYEGKIGQYFSRKKIRLQAFFKNSSDNILDWKSQTTRFNNWGVNTTFRFPKAPYFTFLYSPYHSTYDTGSQTINFNASNASFSSGYNLRFKSFSSFTNVVATFQNGRNNLETGDTKMKNMNLIFSETIDLSKPFSINGSIGLNALETGLTERNTLNWNGKITYKGIKWMRNMLSISHTSWKERMNRTKASLNTMIDMGKFGDLTVQANRNIYNNKNLPENDYSEFVFRIGFAHRW